MTNVAELQNISLNLNGQQILKGINLHLKTGEITTLIGPNGGGKTSIARLIIGAIKPDSGKITIKKNCKIGYMPQKLIIDHTIPLKVIDFVKLTTIPNSTSKESIKKLAARLAIEKILEKQIHHISGGELQKVSLMRALINNPEILILDEPTQFMDIAAQAEFYQLIDEIREKNNCAILIISHDLHMVMQKTNQVICVNHHICCHGNPETISNHPEYLSLFGKSPINNIAIYSHHHDHRH